MAKQKIIIKLSANDKETLSSIISKGASTTLTIRRAHILLNSNAEGEKQHTIDELPDLFVEHFKADSLQGPQRIRSQWYRMYISQEAQDTSSGGQGYW